MNLIQFIESGLGSEWIDEPGLCYYVRKSIFFYNAIELSNCFSRGEPTQFGYYRFLKRYEHVIPFVAENVINADLAGLYRRRNWLERDCEGLPQFASPLMVRIFGTDEHFKRLWRL